MLFPLDINKGLVTNMPATQLPSGAASSCSNFITNNGYLQLRPTAKTTSYSTVSGKSIYHIDIYTNSSNVSKLVILALTVATSKVTVYYWSGTAWVDITGGATITGSYSHLPQSVNFKGNWFFTTGEDDLYYWDGSASIAKVTNATPARIPHNNPRVLWASNSRLFLGDVKVSGTQTGYELDFSNWQTYDEWNGYQSSRTNYLMDESDPITAGAISNFNVFAFKSRQIYASASTGSPSYYEFRKIRNTCGCIAPRTLKAYEDVLIFLGENNVYALQGTTPTPIGDAIMPRLKDIINTTYVSNSMAAIDLDNFLYHLFVPTTASFNCSRVFTFDVKANSWYESTLGTSSKTWVSVCDKSSTLFSPSILLGTAEGKIYSYEFSNYLDGTEKVTPSWTSGIIDIVSLSEGQLENGILNRIIMEADSGDYLISLTYGDYLDDLHAENNIDTLTWDYSACRGRYITPGITGRYFKLNITSRNVGTNPPMLSRVYLSFDPTKSKIRN